MFNRIIDTNKHSILLWTFPIENIIIEFKQIIRINKSICNIIYFNREFVFKSSLYNILYTNIFNKQIIRVKIILNNRRILSTSYLSIYSRWKITSDIFTSFWSLNGINKSKERVLNFSLMPCDLTFTFRSNNYFSFLDEIIVYCFIFVLHFTKTRRLNRTIRRCKWTFHSFSNFGWIVLCTIFESRL